MTVVKMGLIIQMLWATLDFDYRSSNEIRNMWNLQMITTWSVIEWYHCLWYDMEKWTEKWENNARCINRWRLKMLYNAVTSLLTVQCNCNHRLKVFILIVILEPFWLKRQHFKAGSVSFDPFLISMLSL